VLFVSSFCLPAFWTEPDFFLFLQLVMKHGKKVIDEQLPLQRVAEVTMDLYAMAAVTSRATAALNAKGATASHEKLLALGMHFHLFFVNPSKKASCSFLFSPSLSFIHSLLQGGRPEDHCQDR